ncbi:MAG: methyltransferase domain-containing protein [Planctomycetota bacterium]
MLEAELAALGAAGIERQGAGCWFEGDRLLGRRACLWLRTAIRVQELLGAFEVPDRDALYEAVRGFEWPALMSARHTLSVHASVNRSESLRHSRFAALVVKDAVVDALREQHGSRPDVDREDPDVPLRLVVDGERALLYRDLAGQSLHKRGWRPIQVRSPLNEVVAAGLLQLAGWDRRSPLVDPFCGSGTIVIEAALLAADHAPGLGRRFACERWPDHDERAFGELKAEARDRARDRLDFEILGADRHAGALDVARQAARAAGVAGMVRFARSEVDRLDPGFRPAIVVTNPPYGRRIGSGDDLVQAWAGLGDFLRRRCTGASAFVLSGRSDLSRPLGLKASARIPVHNGPIDCRLLRYDIRSAPTTAPATGPEVPPPSAWITRHAAGLAPGSRVLDLACGSGRHTRWLLERGHEVWAVDRDLGGVADLAGRPGLEAVEADLEGGAAWPLAGRRFDAVVVANYLHRPLFPDLVASLAPGGLLLYETFMVGQEQLGRPSNADHLLRESELLEAFAGPLTVLAFEQGRFAEPEPAYRQRIAARGPGAAKEAASADRPG